MTRDELEQIATREAHCKPYGAAVTLSIGERDELVALARDGMRYRWIGTAVNQDMAIGVAPSGLWTLLTPTELHHQAETLDDLVDSQMAKEGA